MDSTRKDVLLEQLTAGGTNYAIGTSRDRASCCGVIVSILCVIVLVLAWLSNPVPLSMVGLYAMHLGTQARAKSIGPGSVVNLSITAVGSLLVLRCSLCQEAKPA